MADAAQARREGRCAAVRVRDGGGWMGALSPYIVGAIALLVIEAWLAGLVPNISNVVPIKKPAARAKARR